MENSKIKQTTGTTASWQLTYAVLILVGATSSILISSISAIFSITMGIFAILSYNAAKKYATSGDSMDLLKSFKQEKVYFIIGFIYCLLSLLIIAAVVVYFYYAKEEFTQWWFELENRRIDRNG